MKKTPAIILPPGFDLEKSYALQRLMQDENHKQAVDYIIHDLAATYADPTDTDSAYLTYKNIGRASVGRAMVQIYKLNLAAVKAAITKERK